MIRSSDWAVKPQHKQVEPFCQTHYQKGLSLKTEEVKIKSYDINSILEGYCTLNTLFFFRRKRFIGLDMYWNCF